MSEKVKNAKSRKGKRTGRELGDLRKNMHLNIQGNLLLYMQT